MSRSDPQSVIDRLVGAAIGLLVAAIAVYVAVKLIITIWPTLVGVLGIGLLLVVAFAGICRWRNRGW